MRRRLALVGVGAAVALLAGCAPAPPSSITLTFRHDDRDREVVLRPGTVTCTDRGVHGIALGEAPTVAAFSFLGPSLDGSLGHGSGGVEDGPGMVLFQAEEIDLDRSDPAIVEVGETPVTITVFPDREAAGPDFDPADGDQVEGVLTARLVCGEE